MSLNKIFQSITITLVSTKTLQCLSFFFLSAVLHVSSLKCICSLDINQVELDHQMLGLSFIAEGHFVSEIQSKMQHKLLPPVMIG